MGFEETFHLMKNTIQSQLRESIYRKKNGLHAESSNDQLTAQASFSQRGCYNSSPLMLLVLLNPRG